MKDGLIVINSIVLLVFCIFTIRFVRRHYLRHSAPVSSTDSKNSPYRFANTVRRILDFCISVEIAWAFLLLIMYVIDLMKLYDPNYEGLGVLMPIGFKLDLTALPAFDIPGLKNQIINGKVTLDIIPPNLFALHLWVLLDFVSALVSLYIIVQLRNIFVSLSNGDAFISSSVICLKRMAFMLIGWNVLFPLLQYFGWGAVLKEISIDTQAVMFYSPFEPDLQAVFIGVFLLVLSGVINEAVKMKDEQRYTI